MPSYRKFKSPIKKFKKGSFKKAKAHHKSPSPARRDYEKRVQTKPSKERCLYIDPNSHKRCQLEIGINPEYCQYHTMLIENLFVAPSNIKGAGNGLFAGPMGFKKGDIIGEYSRPFMKVKQGRLWNRNGPDTDYNDAYVYCTEEIDGQDDDDLLCYDGLDKNSTIVRNANDSHGSKFKHNAYFEEWTDKKGEIHVYMMASKAIPAMTEIFCDYGSNYIFH